MILVSHSLAMMILGPGWVNGLHFIPAQGLQFPPFPVQWHVGPIQRVINPACPFLDRPLSHLQAFHIFGELLPFHFCLDLGLSIAFGLFAHRVVTHPKQQETLRQLTGFFKGSFHSQDPQQAAKPGVLCPGTKPSRSSRDDCPP